MITTDDAAPPRDPEDELRIPDEWDRHLDGRPGGRLSLEQADTLSDDPYGDFDDDDLERVRRDFAAVPFTFVASLPPDEALGRLEDLAPIAGYMGADEQRGAAEAMSVLPTDAAFDALLERATQGSRGGLARNERYFGEALQAACARFPRRALRRIAAHALGSSKPAERCRALLTAHVRRDREGARVLVASMAGDERAAIEAILNEAEVTLAPREAWPAILREPPWTRPKPKAKQKPESLEADPLLAFPKRLPVMPAFWDPAVHPAPQLKSGAGALPPEALEPLGVMLAFSRLDAPYAGLAEVRAACTRDSLARFGGSLFESWLAAGADTKQRWAFLALAWLGDDSIAYRLDALMKDWPRQGAARRAELGLDVLAAMDSDVALVLVNQMAERSRARSLKRNAQRKMAAIARERQLGPDELADRLVPRLGLDDDGAMILDYGPRRFVIGFDEELRPTVEDEGGARRKTLPKPSKSDDPARAPEAERRYKALTKAVRTVAKAELSRLERALASERTWSASDFRVFVVGHPLLVHLARRLVWGRYVDGALAGTFRVAEDRTFADIEDEAIELADGDRVGLAHPLTMSADPIAQWSERFSDYELLPPFPQLAREVFAPPAGQSASEYARGFLGVRVAAHRLLALESRGWQRGEIQDGGAWYHVERSLDPTRTVLLTFSPGVFVGGIADAAPATLEDLVLRDTDAIGALESLTPVELSEVLRDLAWLDA